MLENITIIGLAGYIRKKSDGGTFSNRDWPQARLFSKRSGCFNCSAEKAGTIRKKWVTYNKKDPQAKLTENQRFGDTFCKE